MPLQIALIVKWALPRWFYILVYTWTFITNSITYLYLRNPSLYNVPNIKRLIIIFVKLHYRKLAVEHDFIRPRRYCYPNKKEALMLFTGHKLYPPLSSFIQIGINPAGNATIYLVTTLIKRLRKLRHERLKWNHNTHWLLLILRQGRRKSERRRRPP